MPDMSDDSLVETIRLYRETLVAIRDLYITSGSLIRDSYGWLADDSTSDAASLADQMDDLHQGLVMKVYATAIPSLRADTMHQRQLGRATLEHIWGTTVMGSRLREAVGWLIQESENFRWQDLVRPFAEIPPLRDRWGELEALVTRAATLIATADGDQSTSDNQLLSDMRQQLERLAGKAPEKFVNDAKPSRDAIQWLREEADRLRKGAAVAAPQQHTSAASIDSPQQQSEPISPRQSQSQKALSPSPVKPPQTPPDNRTAEERLADARKKLDELIGLTTIKESIQTLTNFLKLEQLRVVGSS